MQGGISCAGHHRVRHTRKTRLCLESLYGTNASAYTRLRENLGTKRNEQLLLHGLCPAAAQVRVIGKLGFHCRGPGAGIDPVLVSPGTLAAEPYIWYRSVIVVVHAATLFSVQFSPRKPAAN